MTLSKCYTNPTKGGFYIKNPNRVFKKACRTGNFKICNLLFHDKRVNVMDNKEYPLRMIIKRGYINIFTNLFYKNNKIKNIKKALKFAFKYKDYSKNNNNILTLLLGFKNAPITIPPYKNEFLRRLSTELQNISYPFRQLGLDYNNIFVQACIKGNIVLVNLLINHIKDKDKDFYYNMALWEAIQNQHQNIITFLLSNEEIIKYCDLIHIFKRSCDYNNIDIIKQIFFYTELSYDEGINIFINVIHDIKKYDSLRPLLELLFETNYINKININTIYNIFEIVLISKQKSLLRYIFKPFKINYDLFRFL